jgi:iron-sulfur cluster insertion protein
VGNSAIPETSEASPGAATAALVGGRDANDMFQSPPQGSPDMTDLAPSADVSITPSAAKRIAWVLSQDEYRGRMLRISVSGGGCSGFQYGFTFDDTRNDGDMLIEADGARVLIDDVSLEYLKGSSIDYVEDLIGSSFAIKNPQAKSACGCGNSFAV